MSQKAETRQPLTRGRIAAAAVGVMDREGPDALSMRHIGDELGVSAMSLYNHVEDRDDLILAMIDEVMAEFELPVSDVEGWEERVRLLARSYRDVLLAHPGVMQLFTEVQRPSTSIESLRPIEIALVTLRSTGLSEADAVEAYRMFGGYIMGFVLMESKGMFDAPAGMSSEMLAAQIPDALPMLKANFGVMCMSDSSMDFEFGVDIMIAGIRERVRAPHS